MFIFENCVAVGTYFDQFSFSCAIVVHCQRVAETLFTRRTGDWSRWVCQLRRSLFLRGGFFPDIKEQHTDAQSCGQRNAENSGAKEGPVQVGPSITEG